MTRLAEEQSYDFILISFKVLFQSFNLFDDLNVHTLEIFPIKDLQWQEK